MCFCFFQHDYTRKLCCILKILIKEINETIFSDNEELKETNISVRFNRSYCVRLG